MDDKLLASSARQDRDVYHFRDPEEGIGFPLSLNGIGEGYDSCREG